MASGKNVAWSQLRVGIVAVWALVLLAVLIFLITGSGKFFQKKVTLHTFLADSSAMTKGANVRVNGILAGRVSKVELSGLTDPRKLVRVDLEVDEEFLKQIPDNSEAAVTAENVLGSKFINIKKGASGKQVAAGAELKAKDTSDFDDVIESGYRTLVSIQAMLKRVDAIVQVVERGQGSIGKLIYDEQLYGNLNGTAAEARKIMAQLNTGKGTASRLLYDEVLLDDIRGTIARMNSLLEGVQQGQGTAGKLLKDPALYEDLRKTIGEFRTMAADLNAGKGTAGKLLKDEALVNQVNATLKRMDSLVAKIESGQGTLGQLVVNPQLYESLNGTTREMHGLMKDFRANPKKFLSIKLGLF